MDVGARDEQARLRRLTSGLQTSGDFGALVAKQQQAQIAKQEVQIAKLIVQVGLLTEKLNQNSKNSHLPPSSDGPGDSTSAKGKSKKSKNKRKRGGQKGRRGAHRALVDSSLVDEFIEMFPPICLGCSACLDEVVDPFARRYQVVDLNPVKPHITETRRHEVECPKCGYRTLAAYDRSKVGCSSFGPRLTAVIAMLTGVFHLSRRRAQLLLRELFEIEVSLGTISAMESRTSGALEPANEEVRCEVEVAPVKHTDATTWSRAGKLMSLWTIATLKATMYWILKDGRRQTIRPLYGGSVGYLVSDRATVFTFWPMTFRQICWAHLLRKFVCFSERSGRAGSFGRELLACAALVFDYWKGFKNGELTRRELRLWMRPVQEHFEELLKRVFATGIARMSGSCADMLTHAEALWTFIRIEGVEPTNNHAERELRAFVLWRKRSFGSQSERGEVFAARIMTVAHTARKQAKSVVAFIVRSVEAWRDNTPAPRLLASTT